MALSSSPSLAKSADKIEGAISNISRFKVSNFTFQVSNFQSFKIFCRLPFES
jgi:hypothetical protein